MSKRKLLCEKVKSELEHMMSDYQVDEQVADHERSSKTEDDELNRLLAPGDCILSCESETNSRERFCQDDDEKTALHAVDDNNMVQISKKVQPCQECTKLRLDLDKILPMTKEVEKHSFDSNIHMKSTTVHVKGQHFHIERKHVDHLDNPIASGQFGTVFKFALNTPNKTEIAVKIVNYKMSEQGVEEVNTEHGFMEKCKVKSCAYLCETYGSFLDKATNSFCIFMELLNIDLKKLYQSDNLSENSVIKDFKLNKPSFIVRLLKNINEALRFMFNLGYLHRDIKPDNIMISENGEIKLADFGLVYDMKNSQEKSYTQKGTKLYLAPEQFGYEQKRCSIQTDMWALGVTVIEVINEEHPCMGKSEIEQYMKIQNWKPEISIEIDSVDISELILRLVEKAPEDRPQSYDDILSCVLFCAK